MFLKLYKWYQIASLIFKLFKAIFTKYIGSKFQLQWFHLIFSESLSLYPGRLFNNPLLVFHVCVICITHLNQGSESDDFLQFISKKKYEGSSPNLLKVTFLHGCFFTLCKWYQFAQSITCSFWSFFETFYRSFYQVGFLSFFPIFCKFHVRQNSYAQGIILKVLIQVNCRRFCWTMQGKGVDLFGMQIYIKNGRNF